MKILLTTIFCSVCGVAVAQQSINTGGGFGTVPTATVEFAIGELVVTTATTATNTVTQGLLQPTLTVQTVTGTETAPANAFTFVAYPNPTALWLHIETDCPDPATIIVTDTHGNTVGTQPFARDAAGIAAVSFDALPAGIYLVQLYTPAHQLLKSFKIVKQ